MKKKLILSPLVAHYSQILIFRKKQKKAESRILPLVFAVMMAAWKELIGVSFHSLYRQSKHRKRRRVNSIANVSTKANRCSRGRSCWTRTARVSALRGHQVTLVEKRELAGSLVPGSVFPLKRI